MNQRYNSLKQESEINTFSSEFDSGVPLNRSPPMNPTSRQPFITAGKESNCIVMMKNPETVFEKKYPHLEEDGYCVCKLVKESS